MQISPVKNSISFSKKFIKDANVLKENLPYSCKIYQLEKEKDSDYFKKMFDDYINWDIDYLYSVDIALNKGLKHNFIYVLEDKDNNCLGFVEARKNISKKYYDIELVETKGLYRGYSNQKPIKYVAETLLASIAESAKKEDIDAIYISSPLDDAVGFYRKCGYEYLFDSKRRNDYENMPKTVIFNEKNGFSYTPLVLGKENYNNLVEQNKKHTLDCIA